MADRAVSELPPASLLKMTDKLVLEQDGAAKSLTGQVLLDFLTAAADGHGGISNWEIIPGPGPLGFKLRLMLSQSGSIIDVPMSNGRGITGIRKARTNGLTDYYEISYNDGTTGELTVTNGKGIKSITKLRTQGLVDTYTIAYNDGTSFQYTVTNGAKGDKGDNTYTWIKFAPRDPSLEPHSMGDIPDCWVGFYWGRRDSAPAEWNAYYWYEIKGQQGDKGDPARLESWKTEYQVSASGTVPPSGNWQDAPPAVPQGRYLWTRTTQIFNSGDPVVSFGVSYMGKDGAGTVNSVDGVAPGADGNVNLGVKNFISEYHPNIYTESAIVLLEDTNEGENSRVYTMPDDGYAVAKVSNSGIKSNELVLNIYPNEQYSDACSWGMAFDAGAYAIVTSPYLHVKKGQRINFSLKSAGRKTVVFYPAQKE